MNSRRDFLKSAAAGAIMATTASAQPVSDRNELCLFSKHLPEMDWNLLGQNVKKMGFDGVDLTVRPGGHVLPERAAADLPRAVGAIRSQGLSVPMITTGLTNAEDPTAKAILSAASALSIKLLKPGYYKYSMVDVRRELTKAMTEFRGLTELGKQYGVQIGYHNHEGNIGAPLWDVATVIDQLDPKWVGYYFDVRHAVCEGGSGAWKIAFNLIAPRLKMVAIKDFYWDKTSKGWKPFDCPLGEGMVDWALYFKMLRQANFHGPVSLHLEYEIGGATRAAREDNTMVAAKRDFEVLKKYLREAAS